MTNQGVGLQLFEPLAVAAGDGFITEIAKRAWSTYRRVTLRDGGDHESEFVLTGLRSKLLEDYFIDWIGCHFVEKFGAIDCYQGYVHELQLRVGGKLLIHTMDGMSNSVRNRYRASAGGSFALTTATTDADSIAKFGTIEHMMDARIPLSSSRATEKAAGYLQEFAWPTAYGTDLDDRASGPASLYVRTKGYIHTLDRVYYNNTASESDVNLQTQITSRLSGLDFVSVGDISGAPTTATAETSDYITKLRWIGEQLQNTGVAWGCFGGRTFQVISVDYDVVKYRRRMTAAGRRVTQVGGGGTSQVIKPQTVEPYGIMWTEDIFGGPQRGTALRFDPRADIVSGVEVTAAGARFMPANRPGQSNATYNEKYGDAYVDAAGRMMGRPLFVDGNGIKSEGNNVPPPLTRR